MGPRPALRSLPRCCVQGGPVRRGIVADAPGNAAVQGQDVADPDDGPRPGFDTRRLDRSRQEGARCGVHLDRGAWPGHAAARRARQRGDDAGPSRRDDRPAAGRGLQRRASAGGAAFAQRLPGDDPATVTTGDFLDLAAAEPYHPAINPMTAATWTLCLFAGAALLLAWQGWRVGAARGAVWALALTGGLGLCWWWLGHATLPDAAPADWA